MPRRKKQDANPSSVKIIKRYGNRKLYDTEQSSYVTLEGISHMIRKGEDLQVVDNKTGEDLTSIILAQIMLEEEKSKKNALPLSVMKNLIQQSGESLTEWMQKGKESISTITMEGKEQLSRIIELGQETREEGALFVREWFTNQQKYLDIMQKSIDDRIKYFFYHLTGLDELEKQMLELETKVSHLEKQFSSTRK